MKDTILDGRLGDTNFENRDSSEDVARIQMLVVAPSRTKVVVLPAQGSLVLGRSMECDVFVDDPMLSRTHLELRVGRHLEVVDLGSSNGTRVGSSAVGRHQAVALTLSDVVRAGNSTFLFAPMTEKTPLSRQSPSDGSPPSRPLPRDVAGATLPPPGPSSPGVGGLGYLERMAPVIQRLGDSEVCVLMQGEPGVGKARLAHRLHDLSPASQGPLLTVDCGGLRGVALLQKLFGSESGEGSTGLGLLDRASGGTLIFDEVGELDAATQTRLARALERGEFVPEGGRTPRPLKVRVISTTTQDLEADVQRGRFRRDLFELLSGFTFRIPPLRERRGEIEPLVTTFIGEWCARRGRWPAPVLAPEALALFYSYQWPGNLRELRTVLSEALRGVQGATLTLETLPVDRMHSELSFGTPYLFLGSELPTTTGGGSREGARTTKEPPKPSPSPQELKKARILEVLEDWGWNATHAARAMGVSKAWLVAWLESRGHGEQGEHGFEGSAP